MPEYYMNIASILFFICYLPEYYANIINKNANYYNILEKVLILIGSCFALQYAIETNNQPLIINYAPILTLDAIALLIRVYYAYRNRNRNVKVVYKNSIETINIESQEEIVENPMYISTEQS
jgi:uncharacterized protein with PQ loop repeat